MNAQKLEAELVQLLSDERFDEAEKLKMSTLPWLESALQTEHDLAMTLLTLLAQLAGDAESLENFQTMLGSLTHKGLLTEPTASALLENAPANRWY